LLVIYFLPDIAGIHARRITPATPLITLPSIERAAPRSESDQSPLGAIIRELDQNAQSRKDGKEIRETANAEIRSQRITWDVVRSEPVRLALARARSGVAEIIEKIPAEKEFSRIALAHYQLALDQFIGSRDDRFSAEQGLAYIRHLDREVSLRMQEEGAPREVLKLWRQVSIGDALKTGEDRVFRNSVVSPFNPEFNLNYITVSFPPVSQKSQDPSFSWSTKITIQGTVVSRGTKSIKVYHNNRFYQNLEVPKPPKHSPQNWGIFSFEAPMVTGVYTFVIENDDGEKVSKIYSFYPRLLKRVPFNTQGSYWLGRQGTKTPDFDRFFKLRETLVDDNTDGMVPF
jgi:hypothetical protein